MRFKYLSIFILSVVLLASCDKGRTRFYDLSLERADSLDVVVERLDSDAFTMSALQLKEKYGDFLPVYIHGVLHLDSVEQLPLFTSDSGVIALKNYVGRVYANPTCVFHQLKVAFRYYHHYLPGKEVPRVLFHISGFNQAVVVSDGFLSGSVDEYLGSDFEHYNGLAYNYEIPYMTPDQLPLDMMKGWLTATFQESLSGDRLLDLMLYNGKITYLMSVFFPDVQLSSILQYSKQQYEWCGRYEKEVWASIMESRELFSTDWKVSTKYISPAPFTPGFSQESPGRLGVYIGYRIVESFMNNNPHATLNDLMNFTDSQLFLQQSAYRP